MRQDKLTAKQIAFYRENGYLELDEITTPEEVEQVKSIYDWLFIERIGHDVGDYFDLAGNDVSGAKARLPQLMNPANYAPKLAEAAFRHSAFAIARQLLGETAEAGDEHAIFKPAGDGAETPWHQDEAYWDPHYEYEALSVWMPLQEATVDNGCLQFIPQSHRLGLLDHDSIGGDPRIHGLETTEEVDASLAVACPLSTGCCTVHHCRTLHYAGPNRTGTPRRAYILTFRLPSRRLNTPRRFSWLESRQTAREEGAKQT